jgi:trk system potassium uptake protein TrkA
VYVVIAGLSNVGTNLAELLSRAGNDVVVVDLSEERCTEAASTSDIMVMAGDATKGPVLEEAGIKRADVLAALTNDDSDNLMICMLGQQLGAKKVISMVNDMTRADSFKQAGITYLVRPDAVLAKHIQYMISQPYVKESVPFGGGELFEIEVGEGMRCVGKTLSEINAHNGAKIIVVMRGGKRLEAEFVLQPGDWLALIVDQESMKKSVNLMNKWFTKE